MSEIWENDELKEKLLKLSPELQAAFLQKVEKLYNKESEVMLSFIEESRLDMQLTAEEIMREQDALRDTSNLFKKMGKDEKIRPSSSHDRRAVDDYLRRKQGAGDDSLVGALDNLNLDLDFVTFDDDEMMAMNKKKKKKEKGNKKSKKREQEYKDQVTIDDIAEVYQEETHQILRGLSATERQQEDERTRQAEMMREKKEKRRQKKQAVEELLEQAKGHEEIINKTKDRHKQMLEERLEEKRRRKKAGSREDSFVSSISVDSGITVEFGGKTSARSKIKEEVINIEDIEDEPPKKTKKNKKQKEETVTIDNLDEEPPKKEKKKKRQEEIVLDVNELVDKPKKKNKKKEVVEEIVDLEDLEEEKPKKKKKKAAAVREEPEVEPEVVQKEKKKKKKKQQDDLVVEDW